jgi:hypothetical protein
MSDTLPARDDDRFEEVLGRLDALVRRGQPDNDPPPPPPAVSEATIPVLTEVYRPEFVVVDEVARAPALSADEQLEQAMTLVLPVMAETVGAIMEETVRPALEQALRETLAELRPQVEDLLRQRLRQALTRPEA